jgi:predicted lactoylglutathione lyase
VLATLDVEWGEFSIAPATHEKPVTRGLHISFAAPSREHVDAFWQAGTEAGYRDDGEPGLRPKYGADYYGGFLLDPDGNNAEVVNHNR